MLRAIMVGAAAFVLLGAAGCDKDENFVTADDVKTEVNGAVDNAIPKCTPGYTRDCPCPMGASGVQTCAADGKSYSACSDCWSGSPTSGSSSSTGGGGFDVQQVNCDQGTMDVHIIYPGKTVADLANVGLVAHDPGNAVWKYVPVSATGLADGVVWYQCNGGVDFVIASIPR